MSMNYRQYLTVILCMFTALALTYLLTTIVVFEKEVPTLNPKVVHSFRTSLDNTVLQLMFVFNPKAAVREQTLKKLKIEAKPIGKGVFNSQIKNSSYTRYELDKIEWITEEIIFKDGTRKTVQVPKTEIDEIN